MTQRRPAIKILGLSLLTALGLMALSAAAAQAGEYRVNNGTFTAKGVPSKTFLGHSTLGVLLVESGLEIHCTLDTATGSILLGGVAHASVLFSGCTVRSGGVTNTHCQVYESESNETTHTNPGNVVAHGLGEVILHNGSHYLYVASSAGLPFSEIWIGDQSGKKLCTLPLENEVTGSTVLLAPTALTELLLQSLIPLESAEIAALNAALGLGLGLFYGTEPASLDEGEASVHLTSDEVWGAQ